MSSRLEAERRVERIRWPDGPVCPYCGKREEFVAGGEGQIRYECLACGCHRGHIRTPVPPPRADYAVPRRSIVPRFPGG